MADGDDPTDREPPATRVLDDDADDKQSDVLARARDLADAGQHAEAIALLRDARGSWRHVRPAWDELLGRIHLMSGDAAAAIECLIHAHDELLEMGKKVPRSWYHTFGSALVAQGKFEQGGKALSHAEAAGAKINQPVLLAAIEAFRHADENNLDAGPPTPYRIMAQAESMARARDFTGAAALLADHHAAFPDVPPSYATALERMNALSGPPESDLIDRAKQLADAGKYAEAITLLNDMRANRRRVPPAWDELLGRIHLQSGDAAAAAECLTRAQQGLLKLGKEIPGSWHTMFGSALVSLGRFEEGGKVLSEAVAAGVSINQPALSASIEAFRHADQSNLDGGPATPYRIMAQAELIARNSDFAGAAALLTGHRTSFQSVPPGYKSMLARMELLSGNSESDLLAQARELADSGRYFDAITLLQKSRADLRHVSPVWDELLGRVHLMSGDAAAAIECLARAQQGFVDISKERPRSWYHAFGSALVAQGKFEQGGKVLSQAVAAGVPITQPALLASIEAFHHADDSNLDGGEPTPYRVLAQAEFMARDREFVGAAALLSDNYQAFPSVPPAYEIALARMTSFAGDPEAAIAKFSQAAPSYPEGLPRDARQARGLALIDVGRFEEGGQELSRIAADGAIVNRPDAIIAINRYRAGTGEGALLDTRFSVPHTLLDKGRGLVCLSIPKNACTLLKATFVMNSPHRAAYLASGRDIHRFLASVRKDNSPREVLLGTGYFRVIVLRDPMRRLLSAYLEMFVRNRHGSSPEITWHVTRTVRETHKALGIGHDPERSISFAEFVRFLSRADDLDCDVHWMPQVCLAGRDLAIYDHVGRVERLDATLSLLENRFGMTPETSTVPHHARGEAHDAKYSETSALKDPFNALPRELDEYADGVPMPEEFYTDELKNLVLERYAEDVALYASV